MKRKHDTDSAMCWCGPKLEKPCRICVGEDDGGLRLPCWKCHGRGMVDGHPEESGLHVIHNDVDEDDEISPPGSGCGTIGLIVAIAAALLVAVIAMGVFWSREF